MTEPLSRQQSKSAACSDHNRPSIKMSECTCKTRAGQLTCGWRAAMRRLRKGRAKGRRRRGRGRMVGVSRGDQVSWVQSPKSRLLGILCLLSAGGAGEWGSPSPLTRLSHQSPSPLSLQRPPPLPPPTLHTHPNSTQPISIPSLRYSISLIPSLSLQLRSPHFFPSDFQFFLCLTFFHLASSGCCCHCRKREHSKKKKIIEFVSMSPLMNFDF